MAEISHRFVETNGIRCGHWTQQERPREVDDALPGFLDELG